MTLRYPKIAGNLTPTPGLLNARIDSIDVLRGLIMVIMAALKAEIQAIETEWASASTAKDINKVVSLYADDAVEMNDDEPMAVGKAAIRQVLTNSIAKRKPGTTVSFETMDIFGGGNAVTETGKVTTTDAAGKVVSAGKYVGIFEKRDGKYLCIRDINNEDAKEK